MSTKIIALGGVAGVVAICWVGFLASSRTTKSSTDLSPASQGGMESAGLDVSQDKDEPRIASPARIPLEASKTEESSTLENVRLSAGQGTGDAPAPKSLEALRSFLTEDGSSKTSKPSLTEGELRELWQLLDPQVKTLKGIERQLKTGAREAAESKFSSGEFARILDYKEGVPVSSTARPWNSTVRSFSRVGGSVPAGKMAEVDVDLTADS